MIAALAWRAAQMLPVLLVVSLLAFALGAGLGDPAGALAGPDATAAEQAAARHALGLDRSVIERYGAYAWRALHGDLGESWRHARPVSGLLLERLPASLEMAACAAFVAIGVGLPLGLAAALWPAAPWSWFGLGGARLVAAIPPFLLGLLLIQVFAVDAGALPAFGRGRVISWGWWNSGLLTASGRRAVVLPAFTLGLFQAAQLALVARAEMTRALATTPLRFALARGLPAGTARRQAIREARVPLAMLLAPQLGGMLAFAVVTESVFRWPGLGLLLIQSIKTADVPMVTGCLLLAGAAFALLSLAADVLAAMLDPRLRPAARAGW